MRSTRHAAAIAALLLASACARQMAAPAPVRFDVGRAATADDIAAWDTDVNGQGEGLPAGRGTSAHGEAVYARACAACHGAHGEGGAGSQLVKPAVVEGRPRRNIATHWPYAPPLFDYIRRTMPPDAPWSLSNDEVYALLAYLLAENGIVAPGTVVDARALRTIAMPSRDRFVPDSRRGGPEVK